MSFDPVADIESFHEKYGLRYSGPPRFLPPELSKYRTLFMAEELIEYVTNNRIVKDLIQSALISYSGREEQPLDKQLDALIDLVYVVLGTAYFHGFDFREGWRRVHQANMQKVRAIHVKDSARGTTLDVIKPPGWTPPDLSDLVR